MQDARSGRREARAPKRGFGVGVRAVTLVVLFVAGLLVGGGAVVGAAGSQAAVGTVYTGAYPGPQWSSPDDPQGYKAIDRVIVPQVLAPNLFWSTQWWFRNTPSAAYEGIQTDGSLPNGRVGDMALFSVWDAIGAIQARARRA